MHSIHWLRLCDNHCSLLPLYGGHIHTYLCGVDCKTAAQYDLVQLSSVVLNYWQHEPKLQTVHVLPTVSLLRLLLAPDWGSHSLVSCIVCVRFLQPSGVEQGRQCAHGYLAVCCRPSTPELVDH